MAAKRPRPLSPHLGIWKWGPHMAVSILHRITGGGLSVLGLALLAWWLLAIAGGEASYARFVAFLNYEAAGVPLVLIVLIGLSWAFFQHLLSGLRHLAMDSGQGFDLAVNKTTAIATIVGALLLTAALWAVLMGVMR